MKRPAKQKCKQSSKCTRFSKEFITAYYTSNMKLYTDSWSLARMVGFFFQSRGQILSCRPITQSYLKQIWRRKRAALGQNLKCCFSIMSYWKFHVNLNLRLDTVTYSMLCCEKMDAKRNNGQKKAIFEIWYAPQTILARFLLKMDYHEIVCSKSGMLPLLQQDMNNIWHRMAPCARTWNITIWVTHTIIN